MPVNIHWIQSSRIILLNLRFTQTQSGNVKRTRLLIKLRIAVKLLSEKHIHELHPTLRTSLHMNVSTFCHKALKNIPDAAVTDRPERDSEADRDTTAVKQQWRHSLNTNYWLKTKILTKIEILYSEYIRFSPY